MKLNEEDIALLRDYWEDELIATNLYRFLKRKVDGERKDTLNKLAEMELGHANFWQALAKQHFNKEFKKGLTLRIKIFFYKLLAMITPLSFMIYYLELDERDAAIGYSEVLDKFKDDPEAYEKIKEIIYDEIAHEAAFMDMILGEKSYLTRVKEAIYGMTDSLVEILALVIGLASVISDPLTIGLAGLISAIGGTFSMTSGAYLSTKSQNDIYEGNIRDIELKASLTESALIDDIKRALTSKGIDEVAVDKLIGSIRQNKKALENLAKSLEIEETWTDPKEVAITTGTYYILGAIPAVLPFFIAPFLSISTITVAIVAIFFSSLVSFIAGIFTAILSGINIKRKAIENVLIIIGATLATFTIGTVAKILLGIEI